MDGTEDNALFEALLTSSNTSQEPTEIEETTDINNMYDDMPLADYQTHLLFADDDDNEEFLGFLHRMIPEIDL